VAVRAAEPGRLGDTISGPEHPGIGSGQRRHRAAIALALHLDVPIHAEDTVLDAAAVANTAFRAEGDDRTPDEVEEFRRFLDTASPEDFDPRLILISRPPTISQSMIANHTHMRS
jgi:hypothetical protein